MNLYIIIILPNLFLIDKNKKKKKLNIYKKIIINVINVTIIRI